jgi:hypothetical protein
MSAVEYRQRALNSDNGQLPVDNVNTVALASRYVGLLSHKLPAMPELQAAQSDHTPSFAEQKNAFAARLVRWHLQKFF